MSDVVGRGSQANPADLTSVSRSELDYSLYLNVKKCSVPHNYAENKGIDQSTPDKDTAPMAAIDNDVAELAKKLDKRKLELFCTNTYDIVHRKISPRRQLDEIAALFADTFSELLGPTAEHLVPTQQALTLEMLEAMTLKERKVALKRYYSSHTPWESVRSEEPTAEEMHEWIKVNFPDRNELNLVFSDLKEIDKKAYEKILNWQKLNKEYIVVEIPDDRFGFPTKRSLNDKSFELGDVPTGAQIFDSLKNGDPNLPELRRRYSMAQRRKRKLG